MTNAYERLTQTEEDTKNRLITPALKLAGWTSSQMLMEYSLQKDRYRIVPGQNATVLEKQKNRSRPDYILCHSVNMPIAVVEAKRSAKSASDGLDQAINYAKQLDIPFAYSTAGEEFIEFDLTTGEQKHLPLDKFPSPAQLWDRWCQVRGVDNQEKRKQLQQALYYTTADGKIPYYYQMVAINKTVNAVIADQRKRLLLVMATGTGKTFTAFQIVWRLKKAGVVKNVLYLADRNQLIDQTIIGDFVPFKDMTKIRNGKIDQDYELCFGLYQQLKRGDSSADDDDVEDDDGQSLADNYKQVPPDYFDLIIVDECHRGSAREQSSWRDILTYFNSAIQIGLTATPNENEGSDNAAYFGEPIYTYTLKQGIEDGFLAPYQVVTVNLDKDRDGWTPAEGEKDIFGKPLPNKKFTLADFGTTLEIRERTRCVAEIVTQQLKRIGRMSKTIIFCTTEYHAACMRDAMRACNADLVAKEPYYVVRITGSDDEGKSMLDAFTSVNEEYPVVATTSKLLSTGVDTKCVKLIVLDSNIRSMTEFKQIIGRGTRLRPDAGKTFFTILDFRNVCALFKDSHFDGEPDNESHWQDVDPVPSTVSPSDLDSKPEPREQTSSSEKDHLEEAPREIYTVAGVPVEVVGTSVSYLDENGKLVTGKFEDYTRRNILSLFGSEQDFVEVWNGPEEKEAIIRLLADKGILIEHLRKELGQPDMDEFDMIRYIAFGGTPMTRQMRAHKARRSEFLAKYQGVAREVLERLLDIYARIGITEVDQISVLKNEPFEEFGGMVRIVKEFGGRKKYIQAVKSLENVIYQ